MQDLSRLAIDSMWVTSQEGGNMVHDSSLAMTAPGSAPSTPVPKLKAEMADPTVELGAAQPVGTPPSRHASDHSFSPAPMTWKEPGNG